MASVAFACTQTVDYAVTMTVSPTSGTQNTAIEMTCSATDVNFSSSIELSCFFLDEGVSADSMNICMGETGNERFVAGYDNVSGGALSATTPANDHFNVGATGGSLARVCWLSVDASSPETPDYIRGTGYTTFNVTT